MRHLVTAVEQLRALFLPLDLWKWDGGNKRWWGEQHSCCSTCSCTYITLSGTSEENFPAFPLFWRVPPLICQSFPVTLPLYTAEEVEEEMCIWNFIYSKLTAVQRQEKPERSHALFWPPALLLPCSEQKPSWGLGSSLQGCPRNNTTLDKVLQMLSSCRHVTAGNVSLMGCIILNRASCEEWSRLCLYPQLTP